MFKGTTILFVKKDGESVLIGDGQVTLGNTILKHKARKVRRIYKDKIIVGFAGSTADAFTLFSRLESKLEQFSGNLERSVIELAKDWRTDKYLRRLEAMMIVTNGENVYLLSGVVDVVEPDIPIVAIGSGGPYAYAAARALYENSSLSAKEIAEKAMEIAGEICIYTNKNFTIETI